MMRSGGRARRAILVAVTARTCTGIAAAVSATTAAPALHDQDVFSDHGHELDVEQSLQDELLRREQERYLAINRVAEKGAHDAPSVAPVTARKAGSTQQHKALMRTNRPDKGTSIQSIRAKNIDGTENSFGANGEVQLQELIAGRSEENRGNDKEGSTPASPPAAVERAGPRSRRRTEDDVVEEDYHYHLDRRQSDAASAAQVAVELFSSGDQSSTESRTRPSSRNNMRREPRGDHHNDGEKISFLRAALAQNRGEIANGWLERLLFHAQALALLLVGVMMGVLVATRTAHTWGLAQAHPQNLKMSAQSMTYGEVDPGAGGDPSLRTPSPLKKRFFLHSGVVSPIPRSLDNLTPGTMSDVCETLADLSTSQTGASATSYTTSSTLNSMSSMCSSSPDGTASSSGDSSEDEHEEDEAGPPGTLDKSLTQSGGSKIKGRRRSSSPQAGATRGWFATED